MKCPSCRLTVSNSKSTCPRCGENLTEKKRALGVEEVPVEVPQLTSSAVSADGTMMVSESATTQVPFDLLNELEAVTNDWKNDEVEEPKIQTRSPSFDFIASVEASLQKAGEATRELGEAVFIQPQEVSNPYFEQELDDDAIVIISDSEEPALSASAEEAEEIEFSIVPPEDGRSESEDIEEEFEITFDPMVAQEPALTESPQVKSEAAPGDVSELLSKLQSALATNQNPLVKDQLEALLSSLSQGDTSKVDETTSLLDGLASELEQELSMLMEEGTSFVDWQQEAVEIQKPAVEEITPLDEVLHSNDSLDSLADELDQELKALEQGSFVKKAASQNTPQKQEPSADLTGMFLVEDFKKVLEAKPAVPQSKPQEVQKQAAVQTNAALEEALKEYETAVFAKPQPNGAKPQFAQEESFSKIASAKPSDRVMAQVVDVFLAATASLVIAIFTFLPPTLGDMFMSFTFPTFFDMLPHFFDYLMVVLSVWILQSVLLGGGTGQTIGEQIFGLGVVDRNHNTISFKRASMRAGASVLSVLILGAGILPLWGNQKRQLNDWLSDTRVVKKHQHSV